MSLKIWFTLSKKFFSKMSLVLVSLTFLKCTFVIINHFTGFNFIFLAFRKYNRHVHFFICLPIDIIDEKRVGLQYQYRLTGSSSGRQCTIAGGSSTRRLFCCYYFYKKKIVPTVVLKKQKEKLKQKLWTKIISTR